MIIAVEYGEFDDIRNLVVWLLDSIWQLLGLKTLNRPLRSTHVDVKFGCMNHAIISLRNFLTPYCILLLVGRACERGIRGTLYPGKTQGRQKPNVDPGKAYILCLPFFIQRYKPRVLVFHLITQRRKQNKSF